MLRKGAFVLPGPLQQRVEPRVPERVTTHTCTGSVGFFCVERGAALFYSLVYLREEEVAEGDRPHLGPLEIRRAQSYFPKKHLQMFFS